MRASFVSFVIAAVLMLGAQSAFAKTCWVEASGGYTHVGDYGTTYELDATIYHDPTQNLGSGSLYLWDTPYNNTMTLNYTVDVYDSSWNLITTGTSGWSYSGSTTADDVRLAVHVWGQRYESWTDPFDFWIYAYPIGCDS
jgi:hypothetical protein